MATIGQKDATPFIGRGGGKSLEDFAKYPRVTQSPQQYGYNVTPETMVGPNRPAFKGGRSFSNMDVQRATSPNRNPYEPAMSLPSFGRTVTPGTRRR